jgi:hypothetical protein
MLGVVESDERWTDTNTTLNESAVDGTDLQKILIKDLSHAEEHKNSSF